MVSMIRARARRLSPRAALLVEAFTWLLPPALLFGLNLYSGVAGTGPVLLACAIAAAIFTPWTMRSRFSKGNAKGNTDVQAARLKGRVLFGLLQILWAALLLPLSSPAWLWIILLVVAFLLPPVLAGARALNFPPGAVLCLGVTIVLFAGLAKTGKAAPSGVWTGITGVRLRGSLDYAPAIALFLILLPVLLRPGRRFLSVILFFAFSGVTAFLSKMPLEPAALIPPLAFAAVLVFAPGRPFRAPAGWLLYYFVAGLTLAILFFIPSFTHAGDFSRPLLLCFLAGELITPILVFPFSAKSNRES